MIKDRRTGNERRAEKRYTVNIDIEWEGKVGRQQGTISDISMKGCFVLCSGEVDDGERINLFIPIGDGIKVQFWGRVINHVYEIGFGLRFVEINNAQHDFLAKLINSLD